MSGESLIPSQSINALAAVFNELGLDYAFVGAVALALVAQARYTADIDAVVMDIDHRLEWLIGEFEARGYNTRPVDAVAVARTTRVLLLTDPHGVGIDLMLGLIPFDHELVANALDVCPEPPNHLRVIGPEHLIVMKAVAWRSKDLIDIESIIATNPELDRALVLKLFTEFAELLETNERIPLLQKLLESGPP